MKPAIPISEALADEHLLGSALGDVTSWQIWCTILKAAFAEHLTGAEHALFALVAGGRALPSRRVRELWCGPIGRRSGFLGRMGALGLERKAKVVEPTLRDVLRSGPLVP